MTLCLPPPPDFQGQAGAPALPMAVAMLPSKAPASARGGEGKLTQETRDRHRHHSLRTGTTHCGPRHATIEMACRRCTSLYQQMSGGTTAKYGARLRRAAHCWEQGGSGRRAVGDCGHVKIYVLEWLVGD